MLAEISLPFEALVADLRRNGFAIGPGHHLRLQTLLSALDTSCKPTDMKSLLCPIFACTEQQQRLFGDLFDRHFTIFQPGVPLLVPDVPVYAHSAIPTSQNVPTSRFIYTVIAAGIIAVIGLSLLLSSRLRHAVPLPSPPSPSSVRVQAPIAAPARQQPPLSRQPHLIEFLLL